MCMPHRGRLNLSVNLLQFDKPAFFAKLSGKPEIPDGVQGSGDVISHISSSTSLDLGLARPIHVSMLPNPSHLEVDSTA